MTHDETLKLLAMLKLAFHREVVTAERARLYCEFLADLDFDLAKLAVEKIIRTEPDWFPSIAKIRLTVDELRPRRDSVPPPKLLVDGERVTKSFMAEIVSRVSKLLSVNEPPRKRAPSKILAEHRKSDVADPETERDMIQRTIARARAEEDA